METQETEEFDEDHKGPPPADLVRSYLSFALRALRNRRLWPFAIFALGAALTFAAVALWPRTYHCEMKLMAQRSKVYGSEADLNPLAGASDVLGRHENLLAIVKQADLAHSWDERRPPLLRFKDAILGLVRGGGKLSDDDMADALVNSLEARLFANTTENTLTIGTDWVDAQSSARIVEAAHEIFMESRHLSEISTIQEKISILEGHASKAREEIDHMAEQLQHVREERLAQAGRVVKEASGGDNPSPAAPGAAAPRPRPRAAPEPDDQLPALKEDLETKKHTLADLENERNRRLSEAQAKVQELAAKFTPAHPLVHEAEQSVATLSQESPRVSALRAEIDSLEKAIKERAVITRSEPTGGSAPRPAGSAGAGGSELLSSEIMQLLGNAVGVDPAVSAQLQGAVSKYSALRDAISTSRIDLDTAQAAFSYRYKVIVPPVAPGKPAKPKIPVIILGGLLASLLLALLVPILFELRKGVIVERWQIYQLNLPILAELKYPPGSSE